MEFSNKKRKWDPRIARLLVSKLLGLWRKGGFRGEALVGKCGRGFKWNMYNHAQTRRMNSGISVLELGEILLSLFYFNRVFKLD